MKTNTETLYGIVGNQNQMIAIKNNIIKEKDLLIKQYREIIADLNKKIDMQSEMIESLTGNGDSMAETNLVLIAKVKELQSRLDKLTKITLN